MRSITAFFVSCLFVSLPANADTSTIPEVSNFTTTHSMCLDSLLVNMTANSCEIVTFRASDGSLRYQCDLPDNALRNNVYTSRVFYIYGDAEMGSGFEVPKTRTLACEDYSLRIYYF